MCGNRCLFCLLPPSYLRPPASGSRGRRVIGRSCCYERGQLLYLRRVRFPRALNFIDQCGGGVCGGGACVGVGEDSDCRHVTPTDGIEFQIIGLNRRGIFD